METDGTIENNPPAWNAVFSIALGVAGLIMAEFLPIGVLTPMARDLGISEGMTGQSVTATSVAAVFTSLTLAYLSRRMNRRTVMLGLSFLLICSSAPLPGNDYWGGRKCRPGDSPDILGRELHRDFVLGMHDQKEGVERSACCHWSSFWWPRGCCSSVIPSWRPRFWFSCGVRRSGQFPLHGRHGLSEKFQTMQRLAVAFM